MEAELKRTAVFLSFVGVFDVPSSFPISYVSTENNTLLSWWAMAAPRLGPGRRSSKQSTTRRMAARLFGFSLYPG